ncbi:hypothetical protein N9C56_00975 [Paracoccaceae bacterium]|nr:hypothetical protein [Paracoccaceae bacterium]
MARRPRSNIIATPRHAIFFFAFFVIGAVMLSLAKVIPLTIGFERFIIVGLSALLMATYGIFVTIVPATRLRMDVAADNMYYLGFLYTLSSLAVALTVDSTEQILSNFGVAISSTLIGIAARVSLNQLRVDPHDIEAASRLELSEATSRIRAELDETVLQLSSFRTMNLQVLAEGYEEVQKNIEETAAKLFISIENLLQKTAQPLDQLADRASDANTKIMETVNALNESNRDVTKSNRFMIGQIDKATKAHQKLAEFYANKGILNDQVIAGVSTEIERLQRQVTAEARDEFHKLSSAVEGTSVAAARLESSQSELKKSLQDELKSVVDCLGQANTSVESLNEKQSKFARETKDELRRLKNDVQSSLAASAQVEVSVGEVSKSIRALSENKSVQGEGQLFQEVSDKEITNDEAKEIFETPFAEFRNGKVDQNASLSFFEKHNGYNIYRVDNGEIYVAEGVTYGNINDARNAMDRLRKVGS